MDELHIGNLQIVAMHRVFDELILATNLWKEYWRELQINKSTHFAFEKVGQV